MSRRGMLTLAAALALLLMAASGGASAAVQCTSDPRTACFGVESVEASLSSTQAGVPATQAGAHPDFQLNIGINQDDESEPNGFGLQDSFGATRHIRFNLPPGLIGDPNLLGIPQQCTAQQLINWQAENCPNGSQIGVSTIWAYSLARSFHEPLYMMVPPGGDVVARLGTIAGIYPIFIDLRVRSEGDYGIVADVTNSPTAAKLVKLESTVWGVPADEAHDSERCTPREVFSDGCAVSEPRPPGSQPLPFMTNPTRCGEPLTMGVSASSWLEPERLADNEVKAPFPTITGCNRLPFGPSLAVSPTSRRAAAPTGLEMTLRLPAADGIDVLEPSHIRDIRIDLPIGLATNASSADGLGTCSAQQVRFGERVNAECPDAAKLATGEFEVPALPRRLKGAIYLREPEPGNPFRIWVVADDLGAHVKLAGQLDINKQTGQIKSVLLDSPQAPLREVNLRFKSGARAPLVNPSSCGEFFTHYEFTPWSGGPAAIGDAPMKIDEGCDGLGGFAPQLSAGTTVPAAGQHSPFLFTLTRQDGEQNPAALELSLPTGLVANLTGIPRCEGAAALSGQCPPASQIGRVVTAVGAGPSPLWVPQPGKRPTAFYLGGPYKGAPLSTIAVVPAQAGPFDFGDEVVRNAIFVDPTTGQVSAKSDPLPQIIEGVPVSYRAIHVALDRPNFTLNPTSCKEKFTTGLIASAQGAVASASSRFRASECDKLSFKPDLDFRLFGRTTRGGHPRLKATLTMPKQGTNIAATSVALPRSEFLDQGAIRTVCTRVQFAANACPEGSVYGHAKAKTPLFEEPLEGPVYLRSSSNELPDLVAALRGPPSLPIEVDLVGRVDSVNGGIRTTFDVVPDAPVSTFTLTMRGGNKKGLLENSRNICEKTYRATAKFTAHNGRKVTVRPPMKASCGKQRPRRIHHR